MIAKVERMRERGNEERVLMCTEYIL